MTSAGSLRPRSKAGTSQTATSPTSGTRASGATGVPPASVTSGGKLVTGIATSSISQSTSTVLS